MVANIIESFITDCNRITDPDELNLEKLREIDSFLKSNKTIDIIYTQQLLQCISYYTLSENPQISEISLNHVENMIKGNNEMLPFLIERVKPMLLRSSSKNTIESNKQIGLNPKLGLSFKDEDTTREWRSKGGLKSIPFFYSILIHIPNSQVSTNLNWIIPGILNILDDTSDLLKVKLKGVILLRTFLRCCFQDKTGNWIAFRQIGMFEMVEPILVNLCYFLPPAYSESKSIRILTIVYDTLVVLYEQNFSNSTEEMKSQIGKRLLSDVILLHTIPRLGIKFEIILKLTIKMIHRLTNIMDQGIVMYIQRILYTVGEYVVRDSFLTSIRDKTLIYDVLDMIMNVIEHCPDERIYSHRYDFLAIVVIIYEKYVTEEQINNSLIEKLKSMLKLLSDKGCDYKCDKETLIENKGMIYEQLFN